MSIEIKHGNLLESGAPIIAHQVNCQGVMGAGVAKAIREKYPSVYESYREQCRVQGSTLLGTTLLVPIHADAQQLLDGRVIKTKPLAVTIANCYAQDGYGRTGVQTSYPHLRESLTILRECAMFRGGDEVIAMPYKIGCGLAGGNWPTVLEIIEEVFEEYPGGVQVWCLDGKTEFVLCDDAGRYYTEQTGTEGGLVTAARKFYAFRYETLAAAQAAAEGFREQGYNFRCVEA